MRHGPASWPADLWHGADAERPLTPAGIQLIENAAAGLARRLTPETRPAAILHSPLVRARQTAELVAAALRPAEGHQEHRFLEPGFELVLLDALISERPVPGALLLIGHNPDLSDLVGQLTGTPAHFREGSVAYLNWRGAGRARLNWFAPAEELARAA